MVRLRFVPPVDFHTGVCFVKEMIILGSNFFIFCIRVWIRGRNRLRHFLQTILARTIKMPTTVKTTNRH